MEYSVKLTSIDVLKNLNDVSGFLWGQMQIPTSISRHIPGPIQQTHSKILQSASHLQMSRPNRSRGSLNSWMTVYHVHGRVVSGISSSSAFVDHAADPSCSSRRAHRALSSALPYPDTFWLPQPPISNSRHHSTQWRHGSVLRAFECRGARAGIVQ